MLIRNLEYKAKEEEKEVEEELKLRATLVTVLVDCHVLRHIGDLTI